MVGEVTIGQPTKPSNTLSLPVPFGPEWYWAGIELRFGKIFNYLRVHDKGITGRLEAHLYANTLEPTGNGFTVIHSKNASGTFIASD